MASLLQGGPVHRLRSQAPKTMMPKNPDLTLSPPAPLPPQANESAAPTPGPSWSLQLWETRSP